MANIEQAELPAAPEQVFGYLYSVEWFSRWFPGLVDATLVGGDGEGRVHTVRATSGAIESLVDVRIVGWQPPYGIAYAMENMRWGKKGKGKHKPGPNPSHAFVATLEPTERGTTLATLAMVDNGDGVRAVADAMRSVTEWEKGLLAGPIARWATDRSARKTVSGAMANLQRILAPA